MRHCLFHQLICNLYNCQFKAILQYKYNISSNIQSCHQIFYSDFFCLRLALWFALRFAACLSRLWVLCIFQLAKPKEGILKFIASSFTPISCSSTPNLCLSSSDPCGDITN